MRRAQTAPIVTNNTLTQLYSSNGPAFPGARPSLLCLPCSETIGVRKDNDAKSESLWQKLFNKRATTDEAPDYHEPSPTFPEREQSHFDRNIDSHNQDLPTDDSLGNTEENVPVLRFSERFEAFIKRRMLVADLLNPDHTTSILRIFFNIIFGVFICILFWCTFTTLREDLEKRQANEFEAVVFEKFRCQKEYDNNNCEPATRISPLEDFCTEKEICMNQDPFRMIHTTKMTLTLLGEAINAFVDSLTIKAVIVLLAFIFGTIFIFSRSSTNHRPARDFRNTTEYDELQTRLLRIERLSVNRGNASIANGRSGR